MSKKCSCGATIEFVKVGSKSIPCDPKAPIYMVQRAADGSGLIGQRAMVPGDDPLFLIPTPWVSHFNTCPDAGAYSQAKSARLEQLVQLMSAVDLMIEVVDQALAGEAPNAFPLRATVRELRTRRDNLKS